MSKTGWIATVIIIILILCGFWWWSSSSKSAPAPADTTTTSTGDMSGMNMGTTSDAAGNVNDPTTQGAPMNATVTYDGASFSPANVTIAQGGTVTFTDAAGQMWIASNPHPVHTGYDGTSRDQHCATGYSGAAPFDECSPGSSFSFTFNKIGSWGYHDHLNHGATGTVTVVAAH